MFQFVSERKKSFALDYFFSYVRSLDFDLILLKTLNNDKNYAEVTFEMLELLIFKNKLI